MQVVLMPLKSSSTTLLSRASDQSDRSLIYAAAVAAVCEIKCTVTEIAGRGCSGSLATPSVV